MTMVKSDCITVRKKGVIVLPKKVRERLAISEGDLVRVSVDDRGKKAVLSKVDLWGKLMGCARKSYDPDEAEVELDRGEAP
ncbi:MAG: AbrB/MazE/SpoVT family DNA-binding domain-containing protein [Candidatus Verstraetearchaeota archaeon]|nr:AbrB/MazE/SpoVT family DNA-binding domain-containing protein [Candidatus Verstraetearchaeota archaeon]